MSPCDLATLSWAGLSRPLVPFFPLYLEQPLEFPCVIYSLLYWNSQKKQLNGKKDLFWLHAMRGLSIMEGEAWQQEHEAGAYIVLRKQSSGQNPYRLHLTNPLPLARLHLLKLPEPC